MEALNQVAALAYAAVTAQNRRRVNYLPANRAHFAEPSATLGSGLVGRGGPKLWAFNT